MEEKRIKIIIDREGNERFKTISGFAGADCHATADAVMAGVNGSVSKQGDTDDALKADDPAVSVDF